MIIWLPILKISTFIINFGILLNLTQLNINLNIYVYFSRQFYIKRFIVFYLFQLPFTAPLSVLHGTTLSTVESLCFKSFVLLKFA